MRLRLLRPAAVAAALIAAPVTSAQPIDDAAPPPPDEARQAPVEALMVGAATIRFDDRSGQGARQDGVALGYRTSRRFDERFGTAVTFTWGLTDWDRAREWIDAGNDAGSWTTDKIKRVAHWAGEGGDAQPLRLLLAFFAEPFLVATYAAVPFCYVGSAGGATSHLQFDLTGTALLAQGPIDLWAEAGIGAAGIPDHFVQWEYALGPVVGLGLDAGPVRIGGRFLWSPAAFNSSERADDQLFTASLAVSRRF